MIGFPSYPDLHLQLKPGAELVQSEFAPQLFKDELEHSFVSKYKLNYNNAGKQHFTYEIVAG